VIGAGLAGLSAAHTLAKAGKTALVIEKGTYPGSKSITGGRLYLRQIRSLMPDLWNAGDAPFERLVTNEILTFMKDDASVNLELSSDGFKKSPQSCTILRSTFDQWLAAKAEEHGALIVTKTKADEIIRKQNGIVVKAGGDEVPAKMVILAEGSNRRMATKLGLCAAPEARNYATGIKEVIELPEETINERFNLEPGEGTAQLFLGAATKGMKGGGFLYTNKKSISLGVVVAIDAAMASKIETHKLFDDFKAHSSVKKLVRGGKTVEYSAHTIPEGGYYDISRLYDNNILATGDAAGFAMNMAYTVRGMDTAIASGHYAGLAAIKALNTNNFSRESLKQYETALRNSFIFKDMYNYRNMIKFMDNPRIYSEYPNMICDAFERLMRFDNAPKEGLKDFMWDELRKLKCWNTIKDAWSAFRWL
jgi:electron transfer flavoprotein-quinone oxidoreductase